MFEKLDLEENLIRKVDCVRSSLNDTKKMEDFD